ncbi:TNF receptor-associated factor 6-B [Bulinus truncatus]|nr:TNF receptor-associated factor 6-B [Bulinus truncatus]
MSYNSLGQHSSRSAEIPTSSNSNETTFSFSQPMEGYDYEFVPPVEQRYECPICLLILREPRQTKCGHRFCRDCIIRWLRVSCTRCPVDNEPLMENDVFPDNFAKREILNFTIRCPNKKDGCEQVVTLGKLQNHLEICPQSLVPCPYKCASILHRCDLETHLKDHCELRLILCEKCSASIKANSAESHSIVCPNVLLPCDFCGQNTTRAEMKSHIKTKCQKVQIRCIFCSLGCNEEMLRCMEDDHLKSHNIEHMKLLCHAVTNLAYQFENILNSKENRGEMEHIQDDFTSTMSSYRHFNSGSTSPAVALLNYSSLNSLFKNPPPTTTDVALNEADIHRGHLPERHISYNGGRNLASNLLDGSSDRATDGHSNGSSTRNPMPLHIKNSSHSQSVQDDSGGSKHFLQNSSYVQLVHQIKSYLEDKMSIQQLKIDELNQKLANMEKVNMDLVVKVRQLECEIEDREGRYCDGDYYWRIPEFSQYQMKAISGEPSMLHSPPFYTSIWGYKMCIRANITSNAPDTSGHYLSLFIHFMQGHNDNFITWPFSGKIVLSIIDQNPDQNLLNHISETLIAKPNLAAFQKPTSYRNHKGFGYIEFTSLLTLKTNSYLKDDCIIIRAQVYPEHK